MKNYGEIKNLPFKELKDLLNCPEETEQPY
jgi:hypothetical protein